jgi:hypothetical protein
MFELVLGPKMAISASDYDIKWLKIPTSYPAGYHTIVLIFVQLLSAVFN